MFTSATLSRYIGRQFFLWFCLMIALFLGIVFLLDTIELLRRGGAKPDITFWLIMRMALYKLPDTGQRVFPFVILFSSMFTFWRLTRSAELIVARAVGVSVWQFLTPVIITAAMIGVFKVTVINPLGAALFARYERLDNYYLKLQKDTFDISRNGFWLRQTDGGNQYIIHADGMIAGSFEMRNVSVFHFDANSVFLDRMEAKRATLEPQQWALSDVMSYKGKGMPAHFERRSIPTDISMEMIEESFADPSAVSFWALPGFIDTLEATGFPALRHRLFFQSLLSQPVLFCAMVLFAAAFSLRMPRRGGTLIMLTGGVVTGVVTFIATDLIRTFGMTGTVPVVMAAWSPAVVAMMLGTAALLHLEDG